jgi:hypothetical protein
MPAGELSGDGLLRVGRRFAVADLAEACAVPAAPGHLMHGCCRIS